MLTPLKLRAIELAATGAATWEGIATQIGKSETTLKKWRKQAEFDEALTKRRNEYLASCCDTAKQNIMLLGPLAVETLRKAMEKGSVRAALAVAAGTGALRPPPVHSEEKIVIEFGEVGGGESK